MDENIESNVTVRGIHFKIFVDALIQEKGQEAKKFLKEKVGSISVFDSIPIQHFFSFLNIATKTLYGEITPENERLLGRYLQKVFQEKPFAKTMLKLTGGSVKKNANKFSICYSTNPYRYRSKLKCS